MRPGLVLTLGSLLVARLAGAVCPPDCVGGGGPAATDCVIEWGGISGTVSTCVDGTACDVGGTCGVSTMTSVKVAPRTVAAGAALASAMETLTPGQCTAPGFAIPVKPSNGATPIKPGVVKLKVTAVADGKKDPDKLSLTCSPATPSFANDVQPIFTQRCTTSGCHNSSFRAENQVLEA